MNRSVPDALLEQLRLGELPPALAASLRATLTSADHERLAELDADDAAILARHPPALVAAAIRRRAGANERVTPRRRALFFGLPGLAAAAVAIAFALRPALPPAGGALSAALPPAGGDASPVLDDQVRAKGGPQLFVFRRTATGAEPMAPGELAQPGDELRLGWRVDAAVPGVVVSLDGRGVTTSHFPLTERDPGRPLTEPGRPLTEPGRPLTEPGRPLTDPGRPLLERGRTLLDTAYALDDAPEFERFVLVVGPNVSLDRVLQATAALAGTVDAATRPLSLPAGWQQTDFLVRKAPNPRPPPRE